MPRYTRSAAEGKLDNQLAKAFRKRLNFGPPKKVSEPVKSYVKKVVTRNEETKCSQRNNIAEQVSVTGAGLNTSAFLGWVSGTSIIPGVTQGTDEQSRIGNKIKVQKLQLAFTLRAQNVTQAGSLNPFPATPFLCRVIVFRHRYANDDYSQIGILDTGNTMSNLGSTPDSWLQPYNKEEYIILYSKQWTMQPIKDESRYTFPSSIAGAGTTTMLNTPVSEIPQNGSKNFIMKKVNIKLPKTLIYNDNSSLPSNQNLYMAVAVCNLDGTIVSTTQSRVMLNAESYLYYKDA